MSAWLNQAIGRAEAVDDWLAPRRRESLALLREAQWPSRKVEAWRYTPVRALEEHSYVRAGLPTQGAIEAIPGLNSIDLEFVDGYFFSSAVELPAGLSIISLKNAAAADREWVLEEFSRVKPARHVFGLVNDVLAADGVMIDIAPGADIQKPIRIVHRVNGGIEAHDRLLVRLGADAKATIIEHYVGEAAGFNTGFAEFALAARAELQHYRLSLQSGEMISIGGSHFALAEQAKLDSSIVAFGSKLSRADIDVIHQGEKAEAVLRAVYLLQTQELFDLHSNIEHAVPCCNTTENIRGIIADKARAVFNGRIHIHRHAQKTVAELNNRNLLLADGAEINTKPELEIYADDVRCAHGATVAEIDQGALYYLQSRGINRDQALVMLNYGFINELIDEMPNKVLAEWLRPQLQQRFAVMNDNSKAV